ncbi:P2X receptor [Pelomyxa schiedti]|nr:P2X receptor [Pelomyxa schiedti]
MTSSGSDDVPYTEMEALQSEQQGEEALRRRGASSSGGDSYYGLDTGDVNLPAATQGEGYSEFSGSIGGVNVDGETGESEVARMMRKRLEPQEETLWDKVKKPVVMWFKNKEWKTFLTYRSDKIVRIKDFRLGILNYMLLLTAAVVVVFFMVYKNEGYNEYDNAAGLLKLDLLEPDHVTPANSTYCDPSCVSFAGEAGCNCVYWESDDLVYPVDQEKVIFITTRVIQQSFQQRQDPCDGNTCHSPWTAGVINSWYAIDINQYILRIYHQAVAPYFLQQDIKRHDGVEPGTTTWTSSYIKTCWDLFGQLLDANGYPLFDSKMGQADEIPLGTMIEASGENWTRIMELGGMFRVIIDYGDCHDLVWHSTEESIKQCKSHGSAGINYYQYRVIHLPQQFSTWHTMVSVDQQTRAVRNSTGINFVFTVTGTFSKFSFSSLMTTLVSIYIFISLASFIVDFVLLFAMPERKLYSLAKYEMTENFTQMRKDIMQQSSIKNKIETVRQVATYKSLRDVTKLLKEMNTILPPSHMDQLAIACMEVYAEDKDFDAAAQCSLFISGDSSKCTAEILLNHLKEAYLMAVQYDSIEDVYKVKDEASRQRNQTVVSLCQKYLSSRISNTGDGGAVMMAEPTSAEEPATENKVNVFGD